MDVEIAWSPEASEDLESIATYIARDSEFYASTVVTEILAVARHISDFPLIGRTVPEFGNEQLRERFVYSYRVVYRIDQHKILQSSPSCMANGCWKIYPIDFKQYVSGLY